MTKAELDYETKATYMVVVNATDPSGASDSILVTINVTDENDPAEIAGAASMRLRRERHRPGRDLHRR